MRHRLLTLAFATSTFAAFLLQSTHEAVAYPWFARKLVDNCNKCHVSFPKTNDYGWYVKSTGFILPEMDYEGLEESPIKRFFRSLPAALRFKMDAVNSDPSDLEGDINFREVQFISGGTMFNNTVSWWFHSHVVADNSFVNIFDNNPHEMWGQVNQRLGASDQFQLSLRYGMVELPLRFSPSKTKLSEIPYAVYNAVLGNNTFTLSVPQYGPTLKGTVLGGDNFNVLKSSFDLAVVNGTGDFSTHDFSQLFGRVATSVSRAMVGAFAYVGSQEVMPEMDEHSEGEAAHGQEGEHNEEEAMVMFDDNFVRAGLDLDVNISPTLNLYGLALYGRDSNPLALDQAHSGNYYGGFLGLDISPNERWMLQLRYDAVRFGNLADAEHHEEESGHSGGMLKGQAPSVISAITGGGHGGGGHHGGAAVTSDVDAMVLGVHYLLPVPNYQLRLSAEYRWGITGLNDLLLAGIQFAL